MPTDFPMISPIIARPFRPFQVDAALACLVALCVALIILIVMLGTSPSGMLDGGTAENAVSLVGP